MRDVQGRRLTREDMCVHACVHACVRARVRTIVLQTEGRALL